MSDTRIIRVWVDNEFLEIEVDGCANLSEDEMYQAAAEYVYDRISIEVIQNDCLGGRKSSKKS